jgi:hypothetical protein
VGRLLPFSHGEVQHGEYTVAFNGKSRTHVKRKALEYWYQNRSVLQLSLRDFFQRCRLRPDGKAITFSTLSTRAP